MLKRKSDAKADSSKKSTRSLRSSTRKEVEEVDSKGIWPKQTLSTPWRYRLGQLVTNKLVWTSTVAADSASPGSPATQSPIPAHSSAPISAIAARRALALVASTESDQQQDTDNDIDQQLEQEQMTDWDSEGEEENDQSDAESEAENVNSKSKSARSVNKRVKVEKVKT